MIRSLYWIDDFDWFNREISKEVIMIRRWWFGGIMDD